MPAEDAASGCFTRRKKWGSARLGGWRKRSLYSNHRFRIQKILATTAWNETKTAKVFIEPDKEK